MKKSLSQYVLLLVLGLIFVSCNDNPGSDELKGNTPATPLEFTAMVGGNEWTATTATATYSLNCGIIFIQAFAADGTSIDLLFEDIESPVVYPISANSISFLNYTDEFGSVFSSWNSPSGDNSVGSLTLSSFDVSVEKATGSFGGTVYFGGSLFISITNGDFDAIAYTTDLSTENCDIEGPEYPETLVSWRINDFERSANNLISDTSNDTLIALEYGTSAGDNVAFVFDYEIEPGIYQILDENGASAEFKIESVQQYNTGGSITVIEHDLEARYIHGVFNATVVAAVTADPSDITDGEFFINY